MARVVLEWEELQSQAKFFLEDHSTPSDFLVRRPGFCSGFPVEGTYDGKEQCNSGRSRLGWRTIKAIPHNTRLIFEHHYFTFSIGLLVLFPPHLTNFTY